MLVRKSLYGVKSSAAAFRAFILDTMDAMGYRPSYVNPDLWLCPSMKTDGLKYYEYTLCYVDDVLYISQNPWKLMKRIQENCKIRDYKIEPPDIYLGVTLAHMKLESGKYCWSMSPEQYVKAEVTNIEEDLARSGKRLPSKCVMPISSNHAHWMEDLPDLMADGVQQYQKLIGQLRWTVEIRYLDVLLETLLLSSYLAMPQVGHIEQAFHIFGYLKAYPKRKLDFYPAHRAINKKKFHKFDWTDFYRDDEEDIPWNMPIERGNFMSTHCFVDVTHAGNTESRRS